MKNLTRTTKTILFASLIAAMILPFSGMNYAVAEKETVTYEVEDITSSLKSIEEFATVNSDGSVTVDDSKASKKIVKHDLKIAKDYLKLQNMLVNQIRENPDEKPVTDERLKKKFAKLFEQIQDSKNGKSDQSQTDSVGLWILPSAFADWGDVCGQSPWNPLPEPVVYELYNSLGSVNYLLGNGYHLIPAYASGLYGDDYAKEVSAYGCYNGEMRHQGVVTSTYEYNSQGSEPNPEILSYTAPALWWDLYVLAWHGLN